MAVFETEDANFSVTLLLFIILAIIAYLLLQNEHRAARCLPLNKRAGGNLERNQDKENQAGSVYCVGYYCVGGRPAHNVAAGSGPL